jgi:cytochrome c-type biogenesis protein CcmF
MPWLSGTALIHSMLILERRDTLKRWCILLAIITFSLSLIGTFLVRSGVLTSVHAFANDPRRGVFILGLLGITVTASFGLYAYYAPRLKNTAHFKLFSREGIILINNLLLITACATVVLGTLYPLLLEVVTGEHITVGAPYFNSTVNIIALPIVFLAYVGSTIRWADEQFKNLIKASILPLTCAILSVAGLWLFKLQASFLAVVAIALARWLLSGTALLAFQRYQNGREFTPKFTAMAISHAGFAFLVLGIAIVSQWQDEKETILQLNKSINIGHYTATLDKVEILPEKNYITRKATFSIQNDEVNITLLTPETRFYPVENNQTAESAIYTTLLSNLYLALGEADENGNIAVRAYYKPGINFIWLGGLMMAVGGGVALLKRKNRG